MPERDAALALPSQAMQITAGGNVSGVTQIARQTNYHGDVQQVTQTMVADRSAVLTGAYCLIDRSPWLSEFAGHARAGTPQVFYFTCRTCDMSDLLFDRLSRVGVPDEKLPPIPGIRVVDVFGRAARPVWKRGTRKERLADMIALFEGGEDGLPQRGGSLHLWIQVPRRRWRRSARAVLDCAIAAFAELAAQQRAREAILVIAYSEPRGAMVGGGRRSFLHFFSQIAARPAGEISLRPLPALDLIDQEHVKFWVQEHVPHDLRPSLTTLLPHCFCRWGLSFVSRPRLPLQQFVAALDRCRAKKLIS